MHALETQGERFSPRDDKEYYESAGYIATAQFGHLLELKYPEEYPGREGTGWDLKNLPFFPERYQYKIRTDAKKRFSTIKSLCRKEDVATIIHCGDP